MKELRALVVGLGSISAVWLPPLQDRVDIVALVDPVADRIPTLHDRRGRLIPGFGSLEEALAATRPTLVVNLTPVEAHRPITLAALAAGCDVIQEKPLASDLDEAKQLVRAAQDAGRTFVVMQNRRQAPGLQTLRSLVANDALGDPSFVAADMFLAHRLGHGDWRATMSSPLLVDMAIHTFDQARYLAGCNAVAAFSHEFNPTYSWFDGHACAVCTFEMEGGIVFSYRGSWIDGGLSTSYDAAWRVHGSLGSAAWDGNVGVQVQRSATGLELLDADRLAVEEPRDSTGHTDAIHAIIDALERGEAPTTTAADNIESLAMVFAAVTSARERRRVTIAELLA